jgi:uncharacterized protein (DUF983 family)
MLPTAELPETMMTRRPEMDSDTGLEIPSLGRTLRLFGRGFLLRCPNCGKGPVLEHWLKMRVRCGSCGIRLERGEHDYFMGSMMLNFVMTGGLLLVAIFTLLIANGATDSTWDILQWGGPVAMVVLPFLLFPYSKLVWLAFDIMLRPVTEQELEWHRAAASEWSTEYAPRQDR